MKQKPVKNSVSRIWTRSQLKQTVKTAELSNYQVSNTEGMTEILDPVKDEIVLRSLNTGTTELVRLNTFYFEPINN